MGTCIAAIQCAITAILLVSTTVSSDDKSPIPADPSSLNKWFQDNVRPLANPAEAKPRTIKVRKDGSGEFKTLKDAINSIPTGNKERVIVHIGPGEYIEKLKIERGKPFVTFLGSPSNMPTLSFDGTARKYGTVYSATLEAEADYFLNVNEEGSLRPSNHHRSGKFPRLKIKMYFRISLILFSFENSAPRPKGQLKGEQAVALRISGDKSAFYNCRFIGFQDTLCDDKGRHLFKDCYIEGTVDYIFGSGKSLYLGTELHVIGDEKGNFITAHARNNEAENTGFSFVHCKVDGNGTKRAYLGRAWQQRPRVVFSYTTMSSVVNPEGWSNNFHPERDHTALFGEYKCKGEGANPAARAKASKQLTPGQVAPFISLGFIEGSKWLLHPPN
ncbi:hypothetical protein BDE02_06G160800 [Populus trichocarpa]|nr:hypothetical protein BDE02_06G160800 [Populus trichocarpa]